MFDKKKYNRLYQVRNREKIYAKHREWILKNKESYQKYQKKYQPKWYLDNKAEHSAKGKAWQQIPENKKKMVKYVQKYTKANKEKVYGYGKQYNKTFEGRFRLIKSNSSKRGFEFNLSLEDFTSIVSKPCVYCGENIKQIGIDRIDNSIGYTKENSAPCCSMCNYMKKNYLLADFISHVKKISQFYK